MSSYLNLMIARRLARKVLVTIDFSRGVTMGQAGTSRMGWADIQEASLDTIPAQSERNRQYQRHAQLSFF